MNQPAEADMPDLSPGAVPDEPAQPVKEEGVAKPAHYDLVLSRDALSLLLVALRQPPSTTKDSKSSGRTNEFKGHDLIRGGAVERNLDDMLFEDMRPVPEKAIHAECPKCKHEFEYLEPKDARDYQIQVRKWERQEHTFTVTEAQRQLCKDSVRRLYKSGNLGISFGAGELVQALGLAED